LFGKRGELPFMPPSNHSIAAVVNIALCLCLAVVGVLFLAGCLVFPVEYYQAGSRHNIKPQTSNELQAGITTKEEVLLTLGEPDVAAEDG
jgi:outer membrane protein assembly factor BamE (lipoprotein component of BamABCDE complex)